MWTLWVKMRTVQRGYKRKDNPQQRSHHERYGCDEKKDHSSDNLYAQDYNPEKHIKQIVQTTWYVHEEQAKHSMYIQKLGDGHSEECQKGPHQDIYQTTWMRVAYL